MTPKNGMVETARTGAMAASADGPAGPGGFIARFLSQVPAPVAATFTETQLGAIKDFVVNDRERSAVDIRWTIPLIWFRFFIVVLAGPERRPAERLVAERAARPILTWSNILVIAVFLAMLLASFVGMNYGLSTGTIFGGP